MALRTRNRGRTGLKDTALARFGFFAHLRNHVMLAKGVGAPSFTRATVATVKDFEGGIRNCLSGEVRFEGQRRVRNWLSVPEDFSSATWTKGAVGTGTAPTLTAGFTAPDGTATAWRCQLNKGAGTGAGDQSYLQHAVSGGNVGLSSIYWKSNDSNSYVVYFRDGTAATSRAMTVTPTWQRVASSTHTGNLGIQLGLRGTITPDAQNTADILIWHPQSEDVTGQSNQNPSEYVSVGAAKLNYLNGTEQFLVASGFWGSSGSLGEVINGQLGNAVAWDITDDAGAAYEYKSQVVVGGVPNDSQRWYYGFRVKKTTGGTAPTLGVDLGLTGGGTPTSGVCRVNTDTGAAPYGSTANTTIVDRGGYWEVTCYVDNNSTGNTTATMYFYPAVSAYGAAADSNTATGTQTIAAPWVAKSNTGYFPVGNVYPYHGACVDGVKYFDYENGNTVSSNVVTEATGRSLDGYSVGHIPGAATDYFEAATTATTRPSGNTEVEIEWIGLWQTGTSSTSVLCSYGDGGAGRGFMLTINNGVLTWYLSTTGAAWADTGRVATTTVPFANNTLGRIKWVRTTAGVNSFYYSLDRGATWTKIGNDVSAASGAIFPTTLGYRFGEWSGGWAGHGRFLRGIIRDTTAGTTLADFNPREGWTENLFLYSEDFTNVANWSPFTSGDGALTKTSTLVAAAGPLGRAFMQTPVTSSFAVGEVLEVSFTMSGINRTIGSNSIFSTAGGSGTFTTDAPTNFTEADNRRVSIKCTCTVAGTFACRIGVGVPGNETGANISITFDNPQLRRLSVAGQRTTSGYLPTTSAALRGWISSTGEQWGMNGAATVLQRQAEGYLSELSTTNLVLQSSNFGTTWTAAGTPTRSAAAAYCGDIALDLIGDDDAGAEEHYYQNVTFTGDAVKSFSALVKQGTSTSSLFAVRDETASAYRGMCAITWVNGAPALTFTGGLGVGSQERPPEAMGNGVYRIFGVTTSVTAANVHTIRVFPADVIGASATPTGTIYIGGVQAENVTFASSLQPTTTGTAARNADVFNYPAAGNFVSNGTLYSEVTLKQTASDLYIVGLQTSAGGNPTIGHRKTTTPYITSVCRNAAAAVCDPSSVAAAVANSAYKQATTWTAAGATANSINGGAVGTNTGMADYASITTIHVGMAYTGAQVGAPVKNIRIAQLVESNTDIVTISK